MRIRLRGVAIAVGTVVAVAGGLWVVTIPTAGQAPAATGQFPAAYRAPRLDGHPDLNGIWEAVTTANWNIEDHDAQPGLHPELEGAYDAQPAGQSIVEGGQIPYRPDALAARAERRRKRDTDDPVRKCYLPGVPRATYMPFPFQIVQGSGPYILMAYEYASTTRTIRMNFKDEAPTDSWMGWSRGRWEGETLVVDVTGFNDLTWFDRAGNFHSDALHVVERYTAVSPYHIQYEATIEDPKTFTRPWKISLPLYRRMDKGVQLLEYKCVPFTEELLYGKLRKNPRR